MSRQCRNCLLFCFVCFVLFCSASLAQDQPPAPKSDQPKPVVATTSRLHAAKTLCIRRPHGNTIPYDAISAGFEGWGRYALVNDESKADLIVEISAPQESGGGFSVSSSTGTNYTGGRPEQTTKSTKEFSNAPVRMVVLDGRIKTVLWSGSEQPRSAIRHKAQEDNQIAAAQELFRKFHDRIEPPPAE